MKKDKGTLPNITTKEVTGITALEASSGGEVLSEGSSPITSRGVVWSKNPNPTISSSFKTIDGNSIGVFVSKITGLTANTTYYVKAYATSNLGTAYGREVAFTTNNIDLKSGLIAYYPLNGNAGDSSGNNLHASVNSALLTTDRFGNPNKAYSFDGKSSYLKVLKNTLLEPADEISISCWIYASYEPNKGSDISSDATQIIRKGNGNSPGYHLSWSNLSNNKLEAHFYGSWGKVVHGIPNESYKNLWHNITMTYSIISGMSKLFIDGKLASSAICSKKLEHSGDLFIGAFDKYQFFTGKLDEIRIYNRVLSDDEIFFLSKN